MGNSWRGAMLPQELVQIVLPQIVVVELEQRLAGLLAKPAMIALQPVGRQTVVFVHWLVNAFPIHPCKRQMTIDK